MKEISLNKDFSNIRISQIKHHAKIEIYFFVQLISQLAYYWYARHEICNIKITMEKMEYKIK